MKKTTIYIDETDLDMLKTAAYFYNCTVSEVIRKGIKRVCSPDNPEIKHALKNLLKIQSHFKEHSTEDLSALVNEARQEVRNAKKGKH